MQLPGQSTQASKSVEPSRKCRWYNWYTGGEAKVPFRPNNDAGTYNSHLTPHYCSAHSSQSSHRYIAERTRQCIENARVIPTSLAHAPQPTPLPTLLRFVQQAVSNSPSSETLLRRHCCTSCPFLGPTESCLLLPYYRRRGSARHSRQHPASCSADRSPPHASSSMKIERPHRVLFLGERQA